VEWHTDQDAARVALTRFEYPVEPAPGFDHSAARELDSECDGAGITLARDGGALVAEIPAHLVGEYEGRIAEHAPSLLALLDLRAMWEAMEAA
jgi:hypothetical protein